LKLIIILKKHWLFFTITLLIINFLLFRFDFSNLNYLDLTLYLYFVLSILLAINLTCLYDQIKVIYKSKSKNNKKGLFNTLSIVVSSMILPFSQVCIAGVCSSSLLITFSAILPGFLLPFIGFIYKFLDFFLIAIILWNALTLYFSKCFEKENKITFKLNKIN